MARKIEKLVFNVDGEILEFERESIKLSEIAKIVQDNYRGHICMGIINNKFYDLNRTLYRSTDIKFVDTTNVEGERLYFRGLSLLLVLACRDLYGESRVCIKHSIGDGLYSVIEDRPNLTNEDIANIKERMLKYVEEDHKIICRYLPNDEAIEKFRELDRYEKVELLKYRTEDLTKVYECCGYFDYFYGHMFPSTGYMKDLDLAKMANGLVIVGPDKGIKSTVTEFKEMPKLSDVYRESEKWSETLGIDTVVDLNKIIEDGKYGEMIRTVEALHEKKIAEIADMIVQRASKVILIAAPSSSGKTSFAHRLSTQLRVNGKNAVPISLDDYFIERKDTPKNEFGKPDYESIRAIDILKFNEDMKKLLNGEEIERIKFDFIDGTRVHTGEKFSIGENEPIVIEGIHGLNPELTSAIDDDVKFKIYISVITQVNLDDHNRIPTTDLRFLRRMVRDYQFRGMDAETTMDIWPEVRAGEKRNIFPYQEEADVMFNSASVYELSVLKKPALEILKELSDTSEHHLEAVRFRKFLQYFDELNDTADIGPTAIIREFIGGSRIV